MRIQLAATIRKYDKKNLPKDILAGIIIMAVSIPIEMCIRDSCKKNTKNSAWSRKLTPAQRLAKLNKQFSKLNLENYLRKYTDRSEECNYKLPSTEELNQIYDEMGKKTKEARCIDCECCLLYTSSIP